MTGDPESNRTAWLDTVSVETQATIGQAPQTTIAPEREADAAARGAFEMLEQLAGTSPTASGQLRPGDVIGRGGMGVIREAVQLALGRTVAIKTLRPEHQDRGTALDLLREAWVTGSLEHPNIVPVHHVGLDEHGQPLIVLKRIEGVEWSTVMGDAAEVRRRFGATDLLAWNVGILTQVLNAIRFAHSRGILHRDLKPSNVMIGDFGEVYVLDWGIAVSLRADPSGRLPLASDARQVAGTPAYMAPEMLVRDADNPLSERTDIYLAGAVLYELLAGRPPHLAPTAVAVMTSVMLSQPALPPKAPPELAAICRRAMHAEPAQRFESAEELRLALQGYLEHRGSDELAARARDRLEGLRVALAAAPDDPVHHREEIYRLFGACRFGFHEALATWPDNRDARAGLVEATTVLAGHELAHDDPRAAINLLGELDEPPPLLETARAAAAAQAARRAELERIGHDHDLAVGERLRVVLAATVGLVFTVIPMLMGVAPLPGIQNSSGHLFWTIVLTLVVGAFALWLRGPLGTTVVNRRIIGSFAFVYVAQSVLVAAAWIAGIPLAQTQVLMIFLYGTVAGMIAITLDSRIGPSAAIYLVAALFAARWPDTRLYLMSGANLSLAITVMANRRKAPGR